MVRLLVASRWLLPTFGHGPLWGRANTRPRPGLSQLQQLTPPSAGIAIAIGYSAGLRRLAERDRTMLRIDWRSPMLRVEFQDVGNTETMRLEGRFVGPFAKDTRDLLTRSKIPLRLVVNLSEVPFAYQPRSIRWKAYRDYLPHPLFTQP